VPRERPRRSHDGAYLPGANGLVTLNLSVYQPANGGLLVVQPLPQNRTVRHRGVVRRIHQRGHEPPSSAGRPPVRLAGRAQDAAIRGRRRRRCVFRPARESEECRGRSWR